MTDPFDSLLKRAEEIAATIAGGKFQWRSARSFDSEWRDWDGVSDPGTKGREWRLVVTLRNGRVEHDAYFMAWPQSR